MFPNTPCTDCNPCNEQVVTTPLPDLSEILCNIQYDSTCIMYTGPDIECLGITTNMFFDEIFQILCNAANNCCNYQPPQDCVVSEWSDWSVCYCKDGPDSCVQIRRREIITPAANGGIDCDVLDETRQCTPNMLCFTFGTALCSTEETEPLQILAAPVGIINDKPSYQINTCAGDFFIWYEVFDNLWHCNTIGFEIVTDGDQTLDNNSNLYPISNDANQIWNNSVINDKEFLISSKDTDVCENVKLCFNIVLQPETVNYPFTFYSNIAPTFSNFANGSYPAYDYTITFENESFNINIFYDAVNGKWVAQTTDDNTGMVYALGILNSTDFYPVGEWNNENNGQTSFYIISSSDETCVQPEDVDCTLLCGNWSDCVGGTRTRVCIVDTPASGNGQPCGELIQTEVCEDPFCLPVTNVNVQIINNTIEVSFTGHPDVSEYHIVYTSDNWATQIEDTFTSSPYIINYKCGEFFEGYISVLCTNTVESSQVPFSIAAPACTPLSLIGGSNLTIPAGNTVSLDQTFSTTTIYSNLNVGTSGSIMKLVQIPNGYVCAGEFSQASIGLTTPVAVNSILLLNSNFTINNTYFGSGFQQDDLPGAVHEVVYDSSRDRLYIGGTFNKYKGVACTPNLIVLVASTGNIDLGFATNSTGAENSNGPAIIKTIAIADTGKIWVGGEFTKMYGNVKLKYLCRFNDNGVIDFSLNTGDTFNYTLNPAITSVNSILTDTIGNAYIAGTFNVYNQYPMQLHGIVKLLNDGSIDSSFSTGTIVYDTNCFVPSVNKIVYQNSRILIGGNFKSYNGVSVPGFARIDGRGVLDTTFNLLTATSSATCSEVYDILYKNNKIFIGTSFSSYGTNTKKLYYVLDSTGLLDTSVNNLVNIQTTGSAYGIKSILIHS